LRLNRVYSLPVLEEKSLRYASQKKRYVRTYMCPQHIIQQKRIEHERLRQIHRHKFEEQMRLLEQQHAKEESELLALPSDMRHIAVSAPTTPPRIPMQGDYLEGVHPMLEPHASHLSPLYRGGTNNGVTFATGVQQANAKRMSGNYGSSGESNDQASNLHSAVGYVGAKSMPASRRGSSDSRDGDDILVQSMQGLAVNEANGPHSKPPLRQARTADRFGEGGYHGAYNAGLMLDDELDKDINRGYRFL
jgi:hypothetical protein